MKISKLVFMVTLLEAILWLQPNFCLNSQGPTPTLFSEQTKILEQLDRAAAQVFQAPFTKNDLLTNSVALLGYPQFSLTLFPLLMSQFSELQCHELRLNSELKEKFALTVSHNSAPEHQDVDYHLFDPSSRSALCDDSDCSEYHEMPQTSGSIPVFDNANFNLIASVILSVSYILIKNSSPDVIATTTIEDSTTASSSSSNIQSEFEDDDDEEEEDNSNQVQKKDKLIKSINKHIFSVEEEKKKEKEEKENIRETFVLNECGKRPHINGCYYDDECSDSNESESSSSSSPSAMATTMTPPPLKMMRPQSSSIPTSFTSSPELTPFVATSTVAASVPTVTAALPAVVSVSATPSPKAETVKRRRYHRRSSATPSASAGRADKGDAVPSTLPVALQGCFAAECAEYNNVPVPESTPVSISSGSSSPLFVTQTFPEQQQQQQLQNQLQLNIQQQQSVQQVMGECVVPMFGGDVMFGGSPDNAVLTVPSIGGVNIGAGVPVDYVNGGVSLDNSGEGYFGDGYGNDVCVANEFLGFGVDALADESAEWMPSFDVSPFTY